jgi:hypothetical protein
MNKSIVLALASLTATIGCAEEPAAPTPSPPAAPIPIPAVATNAPAAPATISVQEMLVTGPPQLKLHSLAMISQGNVPGEVDESFLPGFKVCSEDSALPVRSVTAQLLGQYFVQGKENPNPEAVELLIKLSKDDSSDVRYNAVYHGLTQIENKSDEILNLLIDIAATDREQSLYDRIAESLEKDRARVASILDKKLQDGDNIAIYEIYEDLTGEKPANADKYLEMPSSRPRLFIFSGEGSDPEAYKAELEKTLKAEGIEDPNVWVSGVGENYVLLLKTYITKDYLTVENAFANHPKYKITQDMWLTPKLEIQIEAMQKMRQ